MQTHLPLAIRWHGRGGQGVVTASRILATAGLNAGHYLQSLPDFGAERSGAPISAHTRLDTKPPVERGPIEEPDVVIVLDPSLIGQVDVANGLRKDGALILNTRTDGVDLAKELALKPTQELWTLDATEIGNRLLKRNVPNTPILGAFAKVVPVLTLVAVEEALSELMSETFPERIINANLDALREGYAAVTRIQEAVNA